MHISMFISRRRPVWNESDVHVPCTKAALGAQIGAQFMVLLNNPSLVHTISFCYQKLCLNCVAHRNVTFHTGHKGGGAFKHKRGI